MSMKYLITGDLTKQQDRAQQKTELTSSSSSSPAAAFSAICRFLLGASSSSLSSAMQAELWVELTKMHCHLN